ncbi:aminotransferase class III-fold pyridoxal phosphate-dependent enzyme [Chitinimonas lacunae]|uniref:Aminotransferase class III-fold pyridoxal phosphate-dependent enzyme n=1 Tax=Chitinimonas lacunae TaxID=1963018 RepID=A0ABV8MSI6_9NEIS
MSAPDRLPPPPPLLVRGEHETLYDISGHALIDLAGGGLGCRPPSVAAAVRAQSARMGLSNRVLISEPLIELCHRLATLLPAPLTTSYVCNSGDEAFEGALKQCKGLAPQRRRIACLTGCDYGSLSYGRLLTWPEEYRALADFLGIEVLRLDQSIPDPAMLADCYALCYAPLRREADGSWRRTSRELVAALQVVARQAGVPLICHASDHCLGQLGSLFGLDSDDPIPDLLVLGGALGGGMVPIGCFVGSAEAAYRVYGRSSPAKHGSTTAGNPLACVAALAALDLAVGLDAPARCREAGRLLADALSPLVVAVEGAVVGLRCPDGVDAALWADRLREEGVLVRREAGSVLTLRAPALARPEVLRRAALAIERSLIHVGQH